MGIAIVQCLNANQNSFLQVQLNASYPNSVMSYETQFYSKINFMITATINDKFMKAVM